MIFAKKITLCTLVAASFLTSCQTPEKQIAPTVQEQKQKTKANLLLSNFPEKIPRGKVEKYETPQAKYCLVHVRNFHLRDDSTKEEKEKVRQVQSDIYQILSYLVEHEQLSHVYAEGITPEEENTWNFFASVLSQKIDTLPHDSPDYQKLQEIITYDAPFHLAVEGKLRLLASEYKTTQELSSLLTEKLSSGQIQVKDIDASQAIDIITDNREDALLSIISQQESPLVVCINGALHHFAGKSSFPSYPEITISNKDNLYHWNLENPRQKFSLIEITPKSY